MRPHAPHAPQIWDLRQPRPTLSLAAHQFEILTADWCKYNDCILATGSVDKSIKVGAYADGCRGRGLQGSCGIVECGPGTGVVVRLLVCTPGCRRTLQAQLGRSHDGRSLPR